MLLPMWVGGWKSGFPPPCVPQRWSRGATPVGREHSASALPCLRLKANAPHNEVDGAVDGCPQNQNGWDAPPYLPAGAAPGAGGRRPPGDGPTWALAGKWAWAAAMRVRRTRSQPAGGTDRGRTEPRRKLFDANVPEIVSGFLSDLATRYESRPEAPMREIACFYSCSCSHLWNIFFALPWSNAAQCSWGRPVEAVFGVEE